MFPGIVGYQDTVIPEISIGLIAGHDLLFLGEKGQAKSRLMRLLVRFLDEEIPYLDLPGAPVHENPLAPITSAGKRILAERSEDEIPVALVASRRPLRRAARTGNQVCRRDRRNRSRQTGPGNQHVGRRRPPFRAHPSNASGDCSPSTNCPNWDELVQVGLFNILEERDVQIRGYPIRFDLDVMILFSANPATYNRSGKVIPQLKDRIGSVIHTHYPRERDLGVEITEQEAGIDLGGEFPVAVPYFMREIIEQISIIARQSKYVDQQSGVSARLSIANYRAMVASARQRAAVLGERPVVPRISDLGHLVSTSLGKLELDMMSSHQMSERQVLDAIVAEAIRDVFDEYVERHGVEEIAEIFSRGVKVEVGDLLPSERYADRLKHVPPAWEKAFEVNASSDAAIRASCVRIRSGRTLRPRNDLACRTSRTDRVRVLLSRRQMAFRDSWRNSRVLLAVIPAKAGIQAIGKRHWIPAFAGMTDGRTGMTDGRTGMAHGDGYLGTVVPGIAQGHSGSPAQNGTFSARHRNRMKGRLAAKSSATTSRKSLPRDLALVHIAIRDEVGPLEVLDQGMVGRIIARRLLQAVALQGETCPEPLVVLRPPPARAVLVNRLPDQSQGLTIGAPRAGRRRNTPLEKCERRTPVHARRERTRAETGSPRSSCTAPSPWRIACRDRPA